MTPGRSETTGGQPHIPVLLEEVLAELAPGEGERIVDGTFGAGGYAMAILDRPGVQVLGIDRDESAISAAAALQAASNGRLQLRHGRFSQLDRHAEAIGWSRVDGVVLDLGVSSMQIDQADRGFSFTRDGPLDMRMTRQGPSAADVVNTMAESDLADVIYQYGEERKSRRIAKRIVEARAQGTITRTKQLADLVAETIGKPPSQSIHPATRTFQALRIFVNGELHELGHALFAAERILRAGGRLVVVAFHSLEDRIVKRFLTDRSKTVAGGSRHQPAASVDPATFTLARRGAVTPGAREAGSNPRARSARLRSAVRTAEPARGVDFKLLGLAGLPVGPHAQGCTA